MADLERLWTVVELAAFLGYKKATVARMVSTDPDHLPPRAPTHMPRWNPETVWEWSKGVSPLAGPKRGRPRNVPP